MEAVKDDKTIRILESGVGIIPMSDVIFTVSIVGRMGHMKQIHRISWEKIKD